MQSGLVAAQVAAPSLESLPRPATPPAERGPVVPAQVSRWRQEALAYEHGDGVARDPVAAAQLYCRAARYGDAEAQFNLAWMLTNARGIERDDPPAVSPKNAHGLMQLTPETAARFRVRRLTDPAQNIRGGMAYLRWLLAYFEGDLALALAGYNAGERAVERYRGIPPYAETRLYVSRIIAALGGRRSHAFDPTVTPPSDVMIVLRGARRLR